jgi:hypothetical protein
MQVAMDPRNQISYIAIGTAVTDTDPRLFVPELYLNTDVTSMLLEDPDTAIYMAEGSQEKLDAERRSASRVTKISKRRCFSLMPTTSAAGELICAIVILKDDKFKEVKLIAVSAAV